MNAMVRAFKDLERGDDGSKLALGQLPSGSLSPVQTDFVSGLLAGVIEDFNLDRFDGREKRTEEELQYGACRGGGGTAARHGPAGRRARARPHAARARAWACPRHRTHGVGGPRVQNRVNAEDCVKVM